MQPLGCQPVPGGNVLDQGGMLDDQPAPGVVGGSQVFPVGLPLLPFLAVLSLGEGLVEELATGVGG